MPVEEERKSPYQHSPHRLLHFPLTLRNPLVTLKGNRNKITWSGLLQIRPFLYLISRIAEDGRTRGWNQPSTFHCPQKSDQLLGPVRKRRPGSSGKGTVQSWMIKRRLLVLRHPDSCVKALEFTWYAVLNLFTVMSVSEIRSYGRSIFTKSFKRLSCKHPSLFNMLMTSYL